MLIITVDDSAFRTQLQLLQSRVSNLTPIMEAIGNRLENAVRQRFQTRTDPSGAPWAPWKPSTIASYPKSKSKYGPGNGKLLDRSGDMLGSLSYQADATSVTIGFAQPYAVYHEFGTTKKRTMPRRGMLTADPEQGTLGASDQAAVLDMLNAYLGAGLR